MCERIAGRLGPGGGDGERVRRESVVMEGDCDGRWQSGDDRDLCN